VVADLLSVDSILSDCERIDAVQEPGAPQVAGGPASGTGKPADRSIRFLISAPSRQRLANQRAVIVKARCPKEPCTVVLGLKGPGGIKTRPLTRKLKAGTPKQVRLPLGGALLEAVLEGLRRGKPPTLRVIATATDAAGNRGKAAVQVTAKR
jgi:hypothetical protein